MSKRAHGGGSIYQRKDRRWAADLPLPDGKRKTFYAATQKEVRAKLEDAKRQQDRGIAVEAGGQTVSQFLTRWLEDVGKSTLRESSFNRYKEQFTAHVIPVVGTRRLDRLTPQDVQELYSRRLNAGAAPATVELLHNMLHRAMRDAVRWNLILHNPCDLVDAPKGKKPEMRTLSPEEAGRFVAAVKEDRFEALLLLAITSGMRRGELLGLKWGDIDLGSGVLQVSRTMGRIRGSMRENEPKTASSRRRIDLIQEAVDALRRHQTRQQEARLAAGQNWEERDLVFCNRYGRPLNPSYLVDTHFKPLLAKAKLPAIRFHDLRHSAATLLFAFGTHPKIVQELLGHSSIAMTVDTYPHAVPGMQREAVSRLSGLFNGGEKPPQS